MSPTFFVLGAPGGAVFPGSDSFNSLSKLARSAALPLLICLKLFGWLAIKSRTKLEWPPEVLTATGQPLADLC